MSRGSKKTPSRSFYDGVHSPNRQGFLLRGRFGGFVRVVARARRYVGDTNGGNVDRATAADFIRC
jgi:hypothetical protein